MAKDMGRDQETQRGRETERETDFSVRQLKDIVLNIDTTKISTETETGPITISSISRLSLPMGAIQKFTMTWYLEF